MGPSLGIRGPRKARFRCWRRFTPARGVIHPSFPLRGRWERSAKRNKQAPSPSLVFLDISSDETRLRSSSNARLPPARRTHLMASKYFPMCKLCLRASSRHAPKPNNDSNRNALWDSKDLSHNSWGSRDQHRTQFQNPGNGTPKHTALSVFLKNPAQNGACELFAMEHSCTPGFRYRFSLPPSASSPARFRFLPTRLPCSGPPPLAAAIATARNPKSAAVA